jgi:hypothetical protein
MLALHSCSWHRPCGTLRSGGAKFLLAERRDHAINTGDGEHHVVELKVEADRPGGAGICADAKLAGRGTRRLLYGEVRLLSR